jgi:hypothetical protein
VLHHRPELLVYLAREERAREMAAIHLARAAAPPAPGLRARLAAGLARAAIGLHSETAAGVVANAHGTAVVLGGGND